MDTAFYDEIRERLFEFSRTGMKRMVCSSDYSVPKMIYQDREYLNFSSNDYLGIANDKALITTFLSEVKDFRFGSTGSRLITGNQQPYSEFEAYLESIYRRSALVYNSGYHANTGILPALTDKKDLIIADKYVHASIIDGILASKTDFQRFKHNDYAHLEKILSTEREKYSHIWIVTESIFSMDGDRANIPLLLQIKEKYNCLLYVDEAHSIGTDGEKGLGICYSTSMIKYVDVAVFPMGKALAGHGAFVLCSANVKQYLINASRTMIFATSLPPICVQWSHFVFKKMMTMDKEREHLKNISKRLHVTLENTGYNTLGDSHIVPIVIGENEKTLAVSQSMKNDGIWATAIRYPTVPKGQSRIRISLSAAFSDEDIDKLLSSVKHL